MAFKLKSSFIIAIVGTAALAGLIGFYLGILNFTDTGRVVKESKSQAWQAVFLSNGQVYFGHIRSVTSREVYLTNVYYIQNKSSLQPDSKDMSDAADVSLSKLGRFELHCPEDHITINRDQVLFYEDLKQDSKVVMAIEKYLKSDEEKKACYEKQV